MKRLLFYFTPFVIITSILASCSKEEGEGGKGTIFGTVYKVVDNGDIVQTATGEYVFAKDTFAAAGESVYIRYGNNQYGYDDKKSTAFDGTFRFKYLTDGNYTLYALSDMASDEKIAVAYNVKISDGNTVYAGDFYITDGKNNGLCGVVGTLEALYKNNYEYIPGVGLRVYIQEQGSPSIDNVRSDGKGGFTFVKLKPNTTYTVYAENETEKGAGINFVSQEIKTGEAGTISVMEKPLQVIIY